MEFNLARQLATIGLRLAQKTNQQQQQLLVIAARSLHSGTQHQKIPDNKSSNLKVAYTQQSIAEQLRYSSLQPRLKPRPQEQPYPEPESIIIDNNAPIFPSDFHLTSQPSKSQQQVKPKTEERPLAVVFAWLGAKDRHVAKYKEMWNERGFDTYIFHMSPQDLLSPKQKAAPKIHKMLDELYDATSSGKRKDVLLHSFSVGSYVFGEMQAQLIDDKQRSKIQGSGSVDPRDIFRKSVKGLVFDSLIQVEGLPNGVSRTLSPRNELLRRFLKTSLDIQQKLFYYYSGIHYEKSSKYAHDNILFEVPTLLVVSNADYVSTPEMSQIILDLWSKRGMDVKLCNFQDSEHVRHFTTYPDRYKSEIDELLKKMKFDAMPAEVAKLMEQNQN